MSRSVNLKRNIVFSLLCQLITVICGFVVPKLFLDAYGSEAYGATASITQLLAYITLLEGGVGGVARAVLYKPIANGDTYAISAIIKEIKRFFRILSYIFIAYVLILACFFNKMSHIECFDWLSTFLLVIVLSIATFSEYFIGISYSLFLQASQRMYVVKVLSIITTILNTICIIVFIKLGFSLIFVKLVSSFVFAIKPIALRFIVKRDYKLVNVTEKTNTYLKQKWDGLGQHIAFVVHSNTDVLLITIFSKLTQVAVYSVYNMIITQVQNIVTSLTAGVESLFGDMIAKDETRQLNSVFDLYEVLVSIVSITVFSSLTIVIVPFVRLYTSLLKDANYIEPAFAFVLTFSSALFCWRNPYISVVAAAGHFKQTRLGAFGEAFVNMAVSVALINPMGLCGVAIGTVLGTLTRFIYYVVYLTKNIICRSLKLFFKRFILNVITYVFITLTGMIYVMKLSVPNYFTWFILGLAVIVIAALISIIINFIFYRQDTKKALKILLRLKKGEGLL